MNAIKRLLAIDEVEASINRLAASKNLESNLNNLNLVKSEIQADGIRDSVTASVGGVGALCVAAILGASGATALTVGGITAVGYNIYFARARHQKMARIINGFQ